MPLIPLYRLKQFNYPISKIWFSTVNSVALVFFVSHNDIKLPFFDIPNDPANIKKRLDRYAIRSKHKLVVDGMISWISFHE